MWNPIVLPDLSGTLDVETANLIHFFGESDKLLAGKAQDQAHGLGGRRAVGVSSLVSPIGLLCGGGLPRLRLKCCHVFGYTPVTISTSLILANSNLSSKFPIPEVIPYMDLSQP